MFVDKQNKAYDQALRIVFLFFKQKTAYEFPLRLVGSVTLKTVQKDRPLATGEEVYKAQCAACHAAGISGAPIFGNADAWGPRLGQGFEALVQSVLHGKGAMSAQSGGQFTDFEISRAVAYVANAGGGKFADPQAPAAEEK